MQYIVTIVSVLTTVVVLFLIVMHFGFRAPRIRETKTPADFDLPFLVQSIPTVSNKKLFAWLLLADNAAETIIVLHGWGSNSELMLPVAKPFYRAGMNVLLIDSRNHGRSDSDSYSSLPRFAEDMDKAIDWLKTKFPEAIEKIAVLGHSVGAGAVLLSASRRSDIHAVLSVSAFAHPEWMMKRFLQYLHLPAFLVAVVLSYVEWIIGHSYASIAPLNTVCKINAPILLVHGKDDSTVPIEDARAIMANCTTSHLKLIEIDGAGHNSIDKIEQHSREFINFLQGAGFKVNHRSP